MLADTNGAEAEGGDLTITVGAEHTFHDPKVATGLGDNNAAPIFHINPRSSEKAGHSATEKDAGGS